MLPRVRFGKTGLEVTRLGLGGYPFGGVNRAPIHIDGVVGQPTLVVDGETLIEEGEYRV